MIFKRINRAQAETVFMAVQNVSGSTATAGYALVFDVGASVDGVRVTQASATDLQAFAGVADADIANNAFGLIQVYGYRSSVRIYSSAGSSVAGDNLTVVAGAAHWGLTPATTLGTSKAFGFLCEAISASSSSQFATTAKGFIRAL
jgi:hypothetical protein